MIKTFGEQVVEIFRHSANLENGKWLSPKQEERIIQIIDTLDQQRPCGCDLREALARVLEYLIAWQADWTKCHNQHQMISLIEKALAQPCQQPQALRTIEEQEPHGPEIEPEHGLDCCGCGLIALRQRREQPQNDEHERMERAEEALRQICVDHLNFDLTKAREELEEELEEIAGKYRILSKTRERELDQHFRQQNQLNEELEQAKEKLSKQKQ